MEKASVRDVTVKAKRVLVRVDFNVPLDEKTGVITDDSRIRAALPTIQYLIQKDARVILASHLGRPDGQVVESMRMEPVAKRLSELLGQNVATTRDCVGSEVQTATENLKNGEVLLLENLRFHSEEEANNPNFARSLASMADIYVDDAFGTAHRKHASIVGITKYVWSVAGLLLEKEITVLGGLLDNPQHPFCALLGGAKISDKVALLQKIIGKVDCVLIGGGMAATFLKANSSDIGQSLFENDRMETAASIIEEANKRSIRLVLPLDVMVAEEISETAKTRIVPVVRIPPSARIVDIGPETVKSFQKHLKGCKTVFWNGPMGIYEIPKFSEGTRAMAKTLADLKANTVIGGGSTADVVADLALTDKMTFVSTGGGASLSFLSGEKLPGVEALLDKKAASKLK
jgi:phosphoglycerate kinase